MAKINLTKILGLFVVVLMFGSVFLYAFSMRSEENQQKLPDNAIQVSGYTFYETPDGDFGTYLEVEQTGEIVPIVFRLDPRNAENIFLDDTAVEQLLSSNKIYLAYNPNQDELSKVVVSAAQISRILPWINGFRPILAYTEDSNPVDPTIPLKNCVNVDNTTSVVIFNVGELNRIINNDGCILVEGETADDLMLTADKLGMNLVGFNI